MNFVPVLATEAGGMGVVGTIVYFAVIIGIFYFLMIRPQKKQEQAHAAMLTTIQAGDSVLMPSYCVTHGQKYYQYTAVDECTRWTYREMYAEHSTYSSAQFLMNLVIKCPFSIREIQTDNGSEFTNALQVKSSKHKSKFENLLDKCGILYHRIQVATPRHNGKVERQHRIDEARFYKKIRMYSLEDGRKQLERYNVRSNNIPKICLGYRSPNEVLADYLAIM